MNSTNYGSSSTSLAKSLQALAAFGLLLSADLFALDPAGKPWLMPFDVGRKYESDPAELQPSQEQLYEFAWDSFIALNWPYLQPAGLAGQPDTNASVIPIFNDKPADAPSVAVVWETYMVPSDVFIDDPDPQNYPVTWGPPNFQDIGNGLKQLRAPHYVGATSTPFFFPGINQPYTHANVPTGPVVDQNKNYLRYEVTMNQAFFEYVRNFSYFSADVQIAATQKYLDYAWSNRETPPFEGDPSYFQPVPTGKEPYIPTADYAHQGLVEVKAAWRVLVTDGPNPDIPERYFRRTMMLPKPGISPPEYEKTLVGLIGFHIHRVTPTGHLPSTFEHIDNVEILKTHKDPLPRPRTPSLNPGAEKNPYYQSADVNVSRERKRRPHAPFYPNGYEVEGISGQPGVIPKAFLFDEIMPEIDDRRQVNVSRSTPIPAAVQRVNRRYQSELKDSVWRYYQLIGTQNISGTEDNPYVANENPNIGPGIPNNDLGPGIPGPQFSNTTNLVNTTLESYTQPGFSCARCHINAFPQGVTVFPPYEDYFKELHVMSFILLSAKPEPAP